MNSKQFTAVFSERLNEYAVYYGGEIFCHIHSMDWGIFLENFKQTIEVSLEKESKP